MYDIQIKDLQVNYGDVVALKDINLNVRNKSFLGIIGPNGGGKSTLKLY
jgi:zinc transport system ATP-binding protein